MNFLFRAYLRVWYFLLRLYSLVFPRKIGKKGRIRPAPGTVSKLPPFKGTIPWTYPSTWTCPRLSWGMLGNDNYGDCVFAAICHAIMAVGAFLGVPYTFDQAAVVKAYLAYDNGQDNGVNEDQLLSTWQGYEASNTSVPPFGVGGPFIRINPTNVPQLKWAIATFGWVLVGSNLQQAQENQFNKRQMWRYVAGSPVVGGHGVFLGGFDKYNVGPYVVSWGRGFRATWGWVTNTCDEAYTGVLPPHLEAKKYVFSLTQLDEYCSEEPAV